MTMSSRVLTTLGVVLCALGVILAAAAAPVTAGTTAQANPQPHPQQSQPPVEGEVDIDPSDLPGDGSESNPYEISNVSELQAMEDDLDANYELVSDIDASQTAQFNDGRGFDPVGPSFSAQFAGSLDGTNHTITGLTIDRPTENRIGVIGVLANEGTIRNVSIVDADITGNFYTGGVVGTTNGEVVSSSVTGTVTSSSNNAGGLAGSNDGLLRESSARVTVTGENQVGGLVGSNSDTIQNSSATGSVSASRNRVGGLVATNNNNATVENSYATGAVTGDSKVGGLVGLNPGIIEQTFAVGSVSGTSAVGGLVGTNTASFAETPGIVENSYFDELTTGQSTSAGSATGLTTGLTTAQMQGQAARTNMSGLDFENTWTTTSEYPALRVLSEADEDGGSGGDGGPIQVEVDVDPSDLSGDGSESNPYEISNISELQAMEDDLDANYELVSDIDASQTARFNNGSGFDPVGGAVFRESTSPPFTGSFEGDNHTVTGLTINRPDETEIGLFGGTGSDATLTNVTLTGVNTTGDASVGGLVGGNGGLIQNVTASGSVNGTDVLGGLVGINDATITDASAAGSVNGTDELGGLVGRNDATITDASAAGSVNGSENVGGLVGTNQRNGNINNATAAGSVNGSENVGGVVGSNFANITDATATGSVNGSVRVGGLVGFNRGGTVTDSSASGSVTGEFDVGGLVGLNAGGTIQNGTIQNATASGSVTGENDVGGLVGDNILRFVSDGNETVLAGTIQDTFAVGTVSGSGDVGGLVGNNSAPGTTTTGTVEQSYFDEQATGQTTSAGSATGLTTAQMQGQAAPNNMSGFDFDNTWTTTSEYPALRALSGTNESAGSGPIQVDIDPGDLPGDGTRSSPYEIANVSELQAMEDDLDANYKLVSDIDASQTAQFNDGAGFDPIGSENTPFIGSLDGNSRTVTALTINRSTEENVGLFGVCVGELTEVTLTNATVTGNEAVGRLVGSVSGDSLLQEIRVSGKVSGDKDVGGIVGIATGSSTLRNVTAFGEVKGTQDQNVGGLVGFNDGTIQDATASGDVVGGPFNTGGLVGDNNGNLTSVTATTDVSGIEDVGGVVGENNGGTIQNATASGNVTAEGSVGGLVGRNDGTIRESFAVGPVAGDFRVGGLVGLNTATVEQSYFDTEATGQTTSAGSATGLTTAQMQGQAAAENMALAFGGTWQTVSGDYPELIALADSDTDSDSNSETDTDLVAEYAGEDDTVGPFDVITAIDDFRQQQLGPFQVLEIIQAFRG